jgi:hypothetical protein
MSGGQQTGDTVTGEIDGLSSSINRHLRLFSKAITLLCSGPSRVVYRAIRRNRRG